MNTDDIIYLSLLFFSIIFGYYYRTIENIEKKKIIGTIVGLGLILVTSGIHSLHCIFFVLINTIIIVYINQRKCHVLCFIFSFLYLFFFRSTIYFGLPYPPGHTNLTQMMLTLKMIGLALEVSNSNDAKKRLNEPAEAKSVKENVEINISFMEIIHYAFNYIGILTGPYYRYRTFQDYFNKPFSQYVDWKKHTLSKIKFVPLFGILFLLCTSTWPLSYTFTEEFYNEASFLYRYWYIWPIFFAFRMRMYIGFLLSECACTAAGFGVYPTITQSKPGHGPSANFEKLNTTDKKELTEFDYDFETIRNVNPYGSDFCTTYREAMKHWNICVQYWLVVNVYQRFPNKKLRTNVTMLISALWHGVYTGYYVCIATAPLVLLVEDVWVKILLKDKEKSLALTITEWIMLFFKMQIFSYQAIAFHLLELNIIWKYYNSVYHVCLIMYAILYIVGLQILKRNKKKFKTEKSAVESHEITEKQKVN